MAVEGAGPVVLPDRLTVLAWVAEKAQDRRSQVDVAACKVLLDEIRRDAEGDKGGSEFDELDDAPRLRAVG